jgi:hypothetical protein
MSFQIEIDKAIKAKELYFLGDSLPRDWYEGFKIWIRLAEGGDPEAQFNVGKCFASGNGIEKDLKNAKIWFLKAAEKNEPRSHYDLYLLIANQSSSHEASELAYQYLAKAASFGEARALREVRRIQIEREEFEFVTTQKNVSESFFLLLGERKIKEARQFIHDEHKKGHIWLQAFLPFFDLELVSHKVSSRTAFLHTTATGSNLFYDHDRMTHFETVDKYLLYGAVLSIRNNSNKDLRFALVITENFEDDTEDIMEIAANTTITVPVRQRGWSIEGLWPVFDYSSESVIRYQGNGSLEITRKGSFSDSKLKHTIRVPFFKFANKIIVPGDEMLGTVKAKKPKGDDRCFVLTVCYGDQSHPIVKEFREFRDDYLLKTAIGTRFVRQYYRFGPEFSRVLESKPILKSFLRWFFKKLAKWLPKKT